MPRTAGRTRWSTRARSRPRASRPAGQPRRSGRRSATGCRAAGRRLELDGEVLASASATNPPQSRAAAALEARLGCEPAGRGRRLHAAELLAVTARDLALMGATLADGGVQPLTGERVVAEDTCRYVLTVMTTAGLYETSGDWLYDVGLPGKSGIGGGIVMVSPGKGGLGTPAPPPLDAARARAACGAVPVASPRPRPVRLERRRSGARVAYEARPRGDPVLARRP